MTAGLVWLVLPQLLRFATMARRIRSPQAQADGGW
jgi:hypothetical protein